uniref:XRE family transcriptional regulator n=1 Tax=uncultured Dysgonomonas sp. TaxID=206096 RepID=UPI00258C189F|nr:XRE family transcriptional regulator [uncultured Dysgonomonas sp.]
MFDLKKFRTDFGLNQDDLTPILGVTQGFISRVERGKESFPHAYLEKLRDKYGDEVDKYTLIEDERYDKEIPSTQDSDKYLVPLLPISAQGGRLNDFIKSVKQEDCEKIISPVKDATFAISISGDSMAPEYPSGSQVLIKKIDEKAFIEWGRVYVLDTCNGIVVKRVIPSEKEGYIKCVSDNNALIYAPFDVSMNDMFGIYRVMLCMSSK